MILPDMFRPVSDSSVSAPRFETSRPGADFERKAGLKEVCALTHARHASWRKANLGNDCKHVADAGPISMVGDTTIEDPSMSQAHQILLKTSLCVAMFGTAAAFAQTTVDVTVTTAPTTTTAVAPTQDFATHLAKANLAQQGIANPTSAQLGMATTNVQGLRDSGMGWGAIANSLGLRLGDVVSAANRAKQADDARAAASEKSQKTSKSANADQSRSAVASASMGLGMSQGGLAGAGGKGNGKGGGNGGGGGGNGGGNGGGGGGGGNGGGGGKR